MALPGGGGYKAAMPTPAAILFCAAGRGFIGRCPQCGNGALYRRYLKPALECTACGVPFGLIRTDDIAPYFTILIVGHIIVPLLLLVEKLYAPPSWVHMALWLPVTLTCVFYFLPKVKGAIMGWMWWLGIKGDEQH